MANDAVWGETLEIMAAASAFGVNVSVHVGQRRVGDNVVQEELANHYLCGTVEQRSADGLPPVVHGRIYLHSTDGMSHYQWKRPPAPAPALAQGIQDRANMLISNFGAVQCKDGGVGSDGKLKCKWLASSEGSCLFKHQDSDMRLKGKGVTKDLEKGRPDTPPRAVTGDGGSVLDPVLAIGNMPNTATVLHAVPRSTGASDRWELRMDTTLNREFYYNLDSKELSWTWPPKQQSLV
jgi:hypothetical protein